jgi:hypothetical protein
VDDFSAPQLMKKIPPGYDLYRTQDSLFFLVADNKGLVGSMFLYEGQQTEGQQTGGRC